MKIRHRDAGFFSKMVLANVAFVPLYTIYDENNTSDNNDDDDEEEGKDCYFPPESIYIYIYAFWCVFTRM